MSTQTAPRLPEHAQVPDVIDVSPQTAASFPTVELICGDEIRIWLDAPGNIESWNFIYEACSWRTPYLSSHFFLTWIECYGDMHEPLLAIGKDALGAVVAIMPLARAHGSITGAGAHQAEYQGWLSANDVAVLFFQHTLSRIAHAFPRDLFLFKYLPPKLPQPIFERISRCNSRIIIHADVRPILQLDEEAIKKTLAKSGTKSKLSRLRRSGDLIFKRIHSAAELEQYIDQIIDLYDFRQGAMNDTLPFREDSRKRAFHLDWMKRAPEQFHVTVMLLDDRIISALIGVAGGDEVYSAIITHSPFHAQHSPGKLHFYKAALMLAQSGHAFLDLTPGGEWKKRFATTHEPVYSLTAWPTASAAGLAAGRERAGHLARGFLRRVGLPPAQVKRGLRLLRKATPQRLFNRVSLLLPKRTELRIYKQTPAEFESSEQDNQRASVNALSDLCSFKPLYDWQSRQAFLLEAMNRLEAGGRSYTVCADGELLHVGWLSPHQTESMFSEINQRFSYPETGATLYDFSTAHCARRRGHYQRTVCHMLMDLKREGSTSVAYISVLADNLASRRAIEKVGFNYFCSLYRTRVLWHEKHEAFFVVPEQPHEKTI